MYNVCFPSLIPVNVMMFYAHCNDEIVGLILKTHFGHHLDVQLQYNAHIMIVYISVALLRNAGH